MNAEALDLARSILSAGCARNVRISLVTVRAMLADFTPAFQDRALVQLQREGFLVLYRNDNPRSLTAADHAAALTVGDSPRHMVYLAGR